MWLVSRVFEGHSPKHTFGVSVLHAYTSRGRQTAGPSLPELFFTSKDFVILAGFGEAEEGQ
jgi:hypothetical protein